MRNARLLALVPLLFLLTACASVNSRGKFKREIRVESTPAAAQLEVRNSRQKVLYTGQTPATVALPGNEGYFQKAKYTFRFTKPGYRPVEVPVTAELNKWYFGNILFGGLMGSLIIDPLTGAMYTLDDQVTVTLQKDR
jgi:hypothetical protein